MIFKFFNPLFEPMGDPWISWWDSVYRGVYLQNEELDAIASYVFLDDSPIFLNHKFLSRRQVRLRIWDVQAGIIDEFGARMTGKHETE